MAGNHPNKNKQQNVRYRNSEKKMLRNGHNNVFSYIFTYVPNLNK